MRNLIVWNEEVGFLNVKVNDDATEEQKRTAAMRALEEAIQRRRAEQQPGN